MCSVVRSQGTTVGMLVASSQGSTEPQLLLLCGTSNCTPQKRENRSFWVGQAKTQPQSPGKGPQHSPTTSGLQATRKQLFPQQHLPTNSPIWATARNTVPRGGWHQKSPSKTQGCSPSPLNLPDLRRSPKPRPSGWPRGRCCLVFSNLFEI